MEKNSNKKYLLKNLQTEIPVTDWVMCIENFFEKEQAEEFFNYLINYRHILRNNDIRKIISTHSLSVYSKSNNEQLAFVSIYNPINTDNILFKNMKNVYSKAQKLYRTKNIKFSKKIKQLGYSYSPVLGNWKDKNAKDTYQREYIFVIFSENDSPEKFKEKIFYLLKEYKINSVLITDNIESDEPMQKISSKLFKTSTGEILDEFEDTTTDIIEKYFSDLTSSKFLFKIPYENNKKILFMDDNNIGNYYSKNKQEKIRNSIPQSFNMGMLKQSLISCFNNENYNN